MKRLFRLLIPVLIASCSVSILLQLAFAPSTASAESLGASSSLKDGLVAYWKMEEASGTRVDATVRGNDLTDNNTVTQATGKVGNAGQFTKQNQEYLSISDNADVSVGSSNVEFTLWVYLDSLEDMRFVSKDDFLCGGLCTTREYAIEYDAARANRLEWEAWFGGGNYKGVTVENMGPVTTGKWYFIDAYFDSSKQEMGISVNGLPFNTTSTGSSTLDDLNAPLWIGGYNGDYNADVNGRIDEVGLWKRILTKTERAKLYNCGRGLTYPFIGSTSSSSLCAGLVSYWKMDESTGTRIDSLEKNDLTDNNTVTSNSGKINNAGQFTAANSEYLSHGDNVDLSTGNISFTFSVWVYFDSLGNRIIIRKNSGGDREYQISYDPDASRLNFMIATSSTALTIVNANSLGQPVINKWYYIVAWHDASAGSINIQVNNGGIDSVSVSSGGRDSGSPFLIGSTPSDGFFDGRIDEVGFWKRVLSAGERSQLYNGGRGRTYPFSSTPPETNRLSGNGANGAKGSVSGATTPDNRAGDNSVCDCSQGGGGDPINTQTGSFDFTTVDISLPTAAGELVFQRTYASVITDTTVYTTTLGPGWAHNQDTRLIFPTDPSGVAGQVQFKDHSANQLAFYDNGDGTYAASAGVLATLISTTVPTTIYTVTNPIQAKYVFTATGKLTSWQDAQGRTFNYSYDASNRPITITEPLSGRYMAFTYNGSNQLTQVSDSAGRSVIYDYSLTTGDLLTVTDVLGQNWTYIYTGTTHLLTDVKDPQGVTIVHTDYDSQGRAYKQTDGLNQTLVQIQYNVDGTSILTDTRGFTQTHTYDDRNTLTGETMPLGSVITKTYDANLRPEDITDPLSHTTSLEWSDDGANLTQVTDALSNTTRLTYDSLNNLTQTVDARGYTTTMSYTGTLLSVLTDTLGNTTRYTYTTASDSPQPVGLLKAMSDARGNTTQYKYDALGQRTVMTDATGLVSQYAYDTLGRQTTITTAVGTDFQQATFTQYDNAGRVITSTQRYLAGQAANYQNLYNLINTYGYDVQGRVLTTTTNLSTPLEQTDINTYDNNGRLTQVTRNYLAGQVQNYQNRYNLITSYEYDSIGNQIVMTDTLGHVTRTWFDALNRPVTTTTNYTGSGAFVAFDAAKPDLNLTSLTGYDVAGNMISTTQLYGSSQQRTTYTWFDALNRPVTTTTNYTGSGAFVAFNAANPDVNLTSLTGYDQNGNVISTTQLYGSSQQTRTYTWYDALNRPVTTTANYTGSGAFVAFDVANPDVNLTTLTQYDSNGSVISTTQLYGTSKQNTTYTWFDTLSRPVTVTTNYTGTGAFVAFNAANPDLNLTSLTAYDSVGHVLTSTQFYGASGLERQTVMQYDAAGRPVTTTVNYTGNGAPSASTPDQNLRQVTVYGSAAGERTSQVEERVTPGVSGSTLITTTYSYDNLGRVITTTLPLTDTDVATTVATYDALGRVTDSKDPLNHVTHTDYDNLGRVITITANYVNGGAVDTQTNLRMVTTYDAAGNRVSVKDPKAITTQFQYDLTNRLTQVTDALSGVTRYAYDAAGNVITITDALTHSTVSTYDLLSRVITVTNPLTHTLRYAYDAAGNVITTTDALSQVTVKTYDLLNRLKTIDYPAPDADVTYTYDGAGQRTQMTDGLGTTTWSYDLASRPITITDPFTGTVVYAYDSASDRASIKYPDGKTTSYTYDLANRLVQASDWNNQLTKYSYDAASKLVTLSLPNGITSTYGYDNADHLLSLAHQTITQTLGVYTYTVDALGNRTLVTETFSTPTLITYTYDSLSRLTNATYSTGEVFTYTYDAVGNRLTETTLAATTVYTYDNANRLTNVGAITYTWDNNGNLLADGVYTYTYNSANRPTTIINQQSTITNTFFYNGDGARLKQTINGTPTTYTVDLAAGLTQVLVDVTSGVTNTYEYGNGRIAQNNSGSGTSYFLGDALGSVRQLTDISGNVTLAKSYQPYGGVLSSSGAGSSAYGFTSEWTDNTGLVYLRARYYAPGQGRFISKDMWMGEYNNPLTLNGWNYTSANPINYTDPSGYITKSEAGDADEIFWELLGYNIRIKRDWGFIPGLPPGIYLCDWRAGEWTMEDLHTIQAAAHVLREGIRALGGNYDHFVYHQIELRPYHGQGGSEKWYINYQLGRSKPAQMVVHEMGHIVDITSGNTYVQKFMAELGAQCQTYKIIDTTIWIDPQHNEHKDPVYATDEKGKFKKFDAEGNLKYGCYQPNFGQFYEAGPDAGNKNQFLPDLKNSANGPAEDFADTFAVVVTEAYIHSGGGIDLATAMSVYSFYNPNIGKRRSVMRDILQGR